MQELTGFDLTFYITRTILVPNENLTDRIRSEALDHSNRRPITPPASTPPDDLQALRDKIDSQQLDIQALLKMIEQQEKSIVNWERRFDEKLYNIEDQWKIKFDELRNRFNDTPATRSKPITHLTKPLPSPDQIKSMDVELYENFHKPKTQQTKTQAKVQLRIKINESADYWLMPIHRPTTARGRQRIQPIIAEIDAIGRDTFKYAGCRGGDTEQALINHQNRLFMMISGTMLTFTEPKMKNESDGNNAPSMRWCLVDMESERSTK
jgi:hypothetical protein